MTAAFKRVLVLCPGDAVTGGPEVLHQLVHELRKQGRRAAICYYPFNRSFSVPESYRNYDVAIETFSDCPDQIVVIPEIATRWVRYFHLSIVTIWWLSVDNYFGKTGQGSLRDLHGRMMAINNSREIIFSKLKNMKHFAQSQYAVDFLKSRGVDAEMLTDYLAAEHLDVLDIQKKRENWIAFNPRKGAPIISRLRRRLPALKFVPIRNMTKQQVADLLQTVKVYADFGHHPGKDRLPREAAMAGACVITGLQGSARFPEDVAIPERYKLDEHSPHIAIDFADIASSIFADFEWHSRQFEGYRDRIRGEYAVFTQQVKFAFNRLG